MEGLLDGGAGPLTYVTCKPRGSDPSGLSFEEEREFDVPPAPSFRVSLHRPDDPPSWRELEVRIMEDTAKVANGA